MNKWLKSIKSNRFISHVEGWVRKPIGYPQMKRDFEVFRSKVSPCIFNFFITAPSSPVKGSVLPAMVLSLSLSRCTQWCILFDFRTGQYIENNLFASFCMRVLCICLSSSKNMRAHVSIYSHRILFIFGARRCRFNSFFIVSSAGFAICIPSGNEQQQKWSFCFLFLCGVCACEFVACALLWKSNWSGFDFYAYS